MARDGGVGDVGQTQLAENGALFLLGAVGALAHGEKAVEGELERLFAKDLGLERAADQRRAAAKHRDFDALEIWIGEKALFGRGALAAQSAALAKREGFADFRFHQPGQRQVEVVSAQQQVLADGGAGEIDAVAFARHADQREVAGAAAYVADQHGLAVEQTFLRAREIVRDPGIEGGRGLLDQREFFEAGFARGYHGQLARLFVEAGGHREDDVVCGKRRALRLLPCIGQVLQDAGGHFDGREDASALLRIPGQNFGGAIDLGIREPAFGGVHGFGGDQRALLARVNANVFLIAQIQERRQRAERLDASGGHVLRNIEHANGGEIGVFGRIDEGERGVGGAEVDADVHRLIRFRFPRGPARLRARQWADRPCRLSILYDAAGRRALYRWEERCPPASSLLQRGPRFW